MTEAEPKQPAADLAYQAIRDRILSGNLAGGERLKEQSLASDMGVSRTPVREAITRLVHEGFAERGTGYSTRVAEFPAGELDQIFEIRRVLECYAAERAARLASAAEIERLDELTTAMERLTPPGDDRALREISDINAEFHRVIADAAQSPRLKMVLSMAVHVGIVSRTYHSYSSTDLIRSARHHRELVDAIRARAPDWASTVMSSHILAAAHVATARSKDNREPVKAEV